MAAMASFADKQTRAQEPQDDVAKAVGNTGLDAELSRLALCATQQHIYQGDEDPLHAPLSSLGRYLPPAVTAATVLHQPSLVLWPSIARLVTRLRTERRRLSSADLDLAAQICLEIAATTAATSADGADGTDGTDGAPWRHVPIVHVPLLMDRVHLYEDDVLVVRAHLFLAGADESYIHNHGQGMISTCLQGGYLHKIWGVAMDCDGGGGGGGGDGNGDDGVGNGDDVGDDGHRDRNHHFRFTREPGGIYSVASERCAGRLETIVAQPFAPGQSLFISPLAQHTIVATSATPVVTLVVRDKPKRFAVCDVLSNAPVPPFANACVRPLDDAAAHERVLKRLRDALESFRRSLAVEAAAVAPLEPAKGSPTRIPEKVASVRLIDEKCDARVETRA